MSVLLLIVVVLYAFDVSGLRGTTDTIRGYHTVETVVTENGATLVNNGVQVEADGGVAPAGTKIVLSTTSNSQGFLNDPADLTTRLGMGFDIYLDNGQQPQTPVKVTYLQDEKNNFLRKFAGVESPTPDTPSTLFFITARSDTNELEVIQPEIVYDQYENSEEKVIDSASVMMSHFSKGEFRWWNWEAVRTYLQDNLHEWLGTGAATPPDCVGRAAQLSDTTLVANRAVKQDTTEHNVVWPCLEPTSSGARLTLHSNDGRPWLVKTEPDVGTSYSTVSNAGDLAGQALFLSTMSKSYNGASILMPNGKISFDFSSNKLPVRAAVMQSAEISYATTWLYVIDSAFGLVGNTNRVSDILEKPANVECIMSAVETSTAESGEHGKLATAVTSCMSTAISKGVGVPPGFQDTLAGRAANFVLGVLTKGIPSIVQNLRGVFDELNGGNLAVVNIERRATDPQSLREVYFQSPSGNILCEMSDAEKAGTWGGLSDNPQVACMASEYVGKEPVPPPCSQTLNSTPGGAAITRSHDAVRGVCTGGWPWNAALEDFRVLPYGTSVEWSGFRCSSAENGITCTEEATHKGFMISRGEVRLNGGDGTRYGTNPTVPEDGSGFTGKWVGRGMNVHFNADGSGTWRDGFAASAQEWTFSWTDHGQVAEATLGEMFNHFGSRHIESPHAPGEKIYFHLIDEEGTPMLLDSNSESPPEWNGNWAMCRIDGPTLRACGG
ncbi:hypothetical protein [Rhodococcus sp. LW-XY12]|uniref:hypothetical protein n=1 Tax=Rhodococcus sp. LW-XY12 TaxID=2856851 RepID=UPI001C57C646|nr:hypothetical protein [Rhodococcus sp. LW-XY12]QXU56640.1 hypothetical protein KXC42_25760 [Rhodococcus sp. LW-XY12]